MPVLLLYKRKTKAESPPSTAVRSKEERRNEARAKERRRRAEGYSAKHTEPYWTRSVDLDPSNLCTDRWPSACMRILAGDRQDPVTKQCTLHEVLLGDGREPSLGPRDGIAVREPWVASFPQRIKRVSAPWISEFSLPIHRVLEIPRGVAGCCVRAARRFDRCPTIGPRPASARSVLPYDGRTSPTLLSTSDSTRRVGPRGVSATHLDPLREPREGVAESGRVE